MTQSETRGSIGRVWYAAPKGTVRALFSEPLCVAICTLHLVCVYASMFLLRSLQNREFYVRKGSASHKATTEHPTFS